jgi:regulator of replication initiation timing
LFEEISEVIDWEFLGKDFEQTWTNLDLSDEEKTMQAAFEMEDTSPFLTQAALMEAPIVTSNTFESENVDGLTFNVMENLGDSDLLLDPMEVLNEVNAEQKPEKSSAEEVLSIHSYSQPIENQPIKEEPTVVVEKTEPKLRKIQSGRVIKRQRKPVKRFEDSSDESADEEFVPKRSRNASGASTSHQRKTKLYEMPAFADPEMETKRQNAINAKMNRDRKKSEKNQLQTQMDKLKKENTSLKLKNKKYRSRLSNLERRLEIMEAVINTHGLGSALKASGNGVASSSSSAEDEPAMIYNDSE